MRKKAQVALEYMVTYSWALILVVTVVAVLVFVVVGPNPPQQIVSKDPSKILMKASAIVDDVAEIKMQNITGGKIQITRLSLGQGFFDKEAYDAKINGQGFVSNEDISPPIEIPKGGEMHFTGIDYSGEGIGELTIDYLDYANLKRSTTVIASQ